MKSTKGIVHAFIIRIWIEPREVKGAEPIWRGVIEHIGIDVIEEERPMYFEHLDKMMSYFAKYLNKIGFNVDDLGK